MDSKDEYTIKYEGRFLRFVDHNGWEYVERRRCSGVVTIAAITDDEKIVLVEQFRPALGVTTIEMPAGLVGDEADKENEHHRCAAERELLEETGYEAADWTFATEGPASSGLTSEVITFFVARGLRKVGAGGGVLDEAITVHEVAIAGLEAWLRDKVEAGYIIDFKIFTGLYFAGYASRNARPGA